MKNLRPFQIVLLAVFAVIGIGAIVFLSFYQSAQNAAARIYGDSVVIWGTLDQRSFNRTFTEIKELDEAFFVVEYFQVNEDSFDDILVNAIAEGRSPDLVVLPASKLVKHRAKIFPIPYETMPVRTFRDTYLDGTEIFARPDGIYALPITIDPFMMYWNRDMFSSNGLSLAPISWESVVADVVPAITIRDTNRNILQSALPFGEFRNVLNAKEILVSLILQSGSRMVEEIEDKYEVHINTSIAQNTQLPLDAALQFYTDFSNSNSPLYSWNRAQPIDVNAFLAADLAIYFGYGSEYNSLQNRNPNLNFDIAPVPQGANATVKRTFGEFYGLAIPKASQNTQGAYRAALRILEPEYQGFLAAELQMAPARRDLVASGDPNPVRQSMYQSSLFSRSWLDPNPEASDQIFMTMVEDVVSNRLRPHEAVADAVDRLQLAY